MKEISEKLAEKLLGYPEIFGYLCEFGAVIGDNEFIVYFKKKEGKFYLLHQSDLIQEK